MSVALERFIQGINGDGGYTTMMDEDLNEPKDLSLTLQSPSSISDNRLRGRKIEVITSYTLIVTLYWKQYHISRPLAD